MLSRRHLLFGLAGLPAARALRAQDPSTGRPSFSTGVSVVNVLATVRDRHGKIVSDLTKDDFTLEEDGVPQTIRYFSQQSDLPLVLGFLVDSSGSVRNVLSDEVRAARKFLEQVLREDQDRAFLIHFDEEIELLQDLTSSRRKLEDALESIHGPSNFAFPHFQQQFQFPGQLPGRLPGQFPGQYPGQRGRFPSPFPIPGRLPGGGPTSGPGGPPGRPRGRGRGPRGGTCLYDAVFLGADEVMRPEEGRKAMILVSDGLDGGSKESLSSAIEAAQRADTLVYSIRFSGNNPGRGADEGVAVLERTAEETGGSYFDTSERQSLDHVFASIEEELRNQYSLGFTPEAKDAGYRRIRVTVRRKGLTVHARDGYYAS